jgi:hypothetical protein
MTADELQKLRTPTPAMIRAGMGKLHTLHTQGAEAAAIAVYQAMLDAKDKPDAGHGLDIRRHRDA